MPDAYQNLTVWQRSMELVEEIYKVTREFPKEELFGLTSQMRRAAVSVPSNIAEGSKRKDVPEYLQFLRISYGSSAELETQLIIAKRLYGHINYREVEVLLDETQKMLAGLLHSLSEKKLAPRTSHLAPHSGQVMVLTVLALGGTILGATTVAGLLMLYQVRQATDLGSSAQAIFAADAGIEQSFFDIFCKNDATKSAYCPAPEFPSRFSNGASVKATCYDDAGNIVSPCDDTTRSVRSIGTSGNASRAFEANF